MNIVRTVLAQPSAPYPCPCPSNDLREQPDWTGDVERPGTTYQSRLHHIDNLQAAHEYCNRAKGNNPDISEWRHPMLWPLPVARKRTPDHSYLWVPAGR